MWSLSHSQDGIRRTVAALGCTQSRSSLPGPGARSPNRWTSRRKPANASCPVTFCSITAGTRVSKTRWLAPKRTWGRLRWASRDQGVEVGAEAGRVVVGAEHRGEPVERPGGALAPRLGQHLAVASRCDPQRGRAVRRTDAAPGLVAVHPERRVSPAVPLLAQDAEGVARPVGPPHPLLPVDHVGHVTWPRRRVGSGVDWNGATHRHCSSTRGCRRTVTSHGVHAMGSDGSPASHGEAAATEPHPTAAAAARPATRPENRHPPRNVPSRAL